MSEDKSEDMPERMSKRYVRNNVRRYVRKNVKRYVRKNVRRFVRRYVFFLTCVKYTQHWSRMIAVEVRHATLNSQDRG